MTDTSTLADPEDFQFWLEDAAQILKSNGTETHAAKVRAAAAALEAHALTIEGLREALTFYARENNWKSVTVYMCGHGAINCNAMADKGNKARAALQSLNSSPGSGR